MAITATSIADTVAPGSVIGAVSAPAGYSVELIYDSDGRFALSGQDLVVGATLLTPGTFGPGGAHTWPGPILRAVKAGAPYSDLVLRPVITVQAVRSPADIAGLTAAWLSDVGVTANGSGQVTAWAGAYGTAYALTQATLANSPTIAAGYGPGGLQGVRFTSANSQHMNITPALPMTDGTIVAVYQPLDTSANKAILGSGSRFLWQTSSTSVSLNMGSTVAATPVANATLTTNRISTLVVTHDGTTGAYAARVDGVAANGGGNAGVSAAAFTYVGRQASTAYGNYVLMALLVYNRVLTADEIAAVEAWAMGRRTTEWFCAADGQAGNTGFNPASPKPAAQAFLSGQAFRAWDKIRSKGGDLMVGTITALTGGMTAAKPVRAMTYGLGKPRWWGAAPMALAYTGAYPAQTAALARANALGMIWWYRDGLDAAPVQVFSRALTEDRSFQHADGALQIRLEAGRDANAEVLVIPADLSDQQLYSIGTSNFELHGHDVRHFLGQMWSPQGQRTVLRDCYLGFGCDDGHSPGGSLHDCSFNEITATGTSLSITRGPGDGISVHGGSGHTLRYNWVHDCLGPGIRNEEGSGVVMEGNNVENCSAPLRIIKNASYPGPAAAIYRGNRIQRGAGALQRDGLLLDSGLPANIAVTVTDNLFVGEGVADGVAIRNSGLGAVNASGNVQTGFAGMGG
ncbi:right-handed parallel beta-helix repeat-containing protein [Caulobacter endophyticus]|nr:right-handed parallel beta-helix repeat-containing protein [Caulobacter endophyticus]